MDHRAGVSAVEFFSRIWFFRLAELWKIDPAYVSYDVARRVSGGISEAGGVLGYWRQVSLAPRF